MTDLHQPPDDDQELRQPGDSQDDEEEDDEEDEETTDSAFATMEGRVQQATQVAQDVAQAALPADAPPVWQPSAHQELIVAILRDWSKNGTEELVDEDVTNLTGFTRIAAGAGMSASFELRDATFVAVLRGLLEDWVANWSGGEDEEEE